MTMVNNAGWTAAERTNAEILQLATEKAAGTTAETSIQIVDVNLLDRLPLGIIDRSHHHRCSLIDDDG
jgi:hypothetical protein